MPITHIHQRRDLSVTWEVRLVPIFYSCTFQGILVCIFRSRFDRTNSWTELPNSNWLVWLRSTKFQAQFLLKAEESVIPWLASIDLSTYLLFFAGGVGGRDSASGLHLTLRSILLEYFWAYLWLKRLMGTFLMLRESSEARQVGACLGKLH